MKMKAKLSNNNTFAAVEYLASIGVKKEECERVLFKALKEFCGIESLTAPFVDVEILFDPKSRLMNLPKLNTIFPFDEWIKVVNKN